MDVIQLKGIAKNYEGRPVIKDVSVNLGQGEIVSLLGYSGVGKTTLFNIAAGLDVPDEGKVLMDSRDITGIPGQLGYMLQKDMLLPHFNIEDNVTLSLVVKGMKRKEARKIANPYYAEFGLEESKLLYPPQLSGGMRQRAALLRTYLFGAKVLLLDEPFSALDAFTKDSMHKWFINISAELGLSVLLITHDIDEAIILSNRIYLMTGSPGGISSEITIDRAGKNLDDFQLTDTFIGYKRGILNALSRAQSPINTKH